MNTGKMTRLRNSILLLVCAFTFVAASFVVVSAQGTVVVEKEFPGQGETVRIHVNGESGAPVAGATVEVTYRPGSSVERIEPVGISVEYGGLEWTPAEAGIATINATWQTADGTEATGSATVSIRYTSPPITGILIMVIAGLLLVVGSIVRMFNVIRTPQAP